MHTEIFENQIKKLDLQKHMLTKNVLSVDCWDARKEEKLNQERKVKARYKKFLNYLIHCHSYSFKFTLVHCHIH
jgi:hypothetical protein